MRNASQMCWAFLVDGALRLAFNIRVTLKSRQTLARGCLVPFVANGIETTWGWVARVNDLWPGRLGSHPVTSAKGISLVSLVADTDGYMISHSAIRIDAAKTRTWILAAFVGACKFLRAVRVDHTFRTTVGR